MRYLTFDEYQSIGGSVDEGMFNRFVDRACGKIDAETFCRVKSMAEVPPQVKALCRDLVDFYTTNADVTEKGVSSWSENAGAVSQSVSYTSKTADDISVDASSIVYDYLFSVADDNGVPLMFRG